MKFYEVILNDNRKVGTTEGASLAAAKRWAKKGITSTHMGEWRRKGEGYEYATTIGEYYHFREPGDLSTHNYGIFIRTLQMKGIKVDWKTHDARVYMGKRHWVDVTFSYNEPKIYVYFQNDTQHFRILSSGADAAKALIAMEAQFRTLDIKLESIINEMGD